MIDRTWLLSIQKQTNADYLLEIDGQKEIIQWAADHFRGVIAVSPRETALRLAVGHLPCVTVFGKTGRDGIEFSILHLYGKTIAILHEGISPYQIVMVHLTHLLTSYRVICVVIEQAGAVKSILEGLLDPDEYRLETHGVSMAIYPRIKSVSMETPTKG